MLQEYYRCVNYRWCSFCTHPTKSVPLRFEGGLVEGVGIDKKNVKIAVRAVKK